MKGLEVIEDYKDIKVYRDSFFELSRSIFGIDFNRWYQLGFWDHRYIPVSYVVGDQVVSNVSINKLDLIINGRRYSALQLGTVMTRPDYRNRGLSSLLINKVIREYESHVDFIYLFANQNVLDFYPKFGFKRVKECQFTLEHYTDKSINTHLRKLNINDQTDFSLVSSIARNRLPVCSDVFSTEHASSVLMFYCLNVFYNDLHYIESLEAIVIYKISKTHIDVFDIISMRNIDIDTVLNSIAPKGMNRFVFHFTVSSKEGKLDKQLYKGSDVLFVRSKENRVFPKGVKHPITSQA